MKRLLGPLFFSYAIVARAQDCLPPKSVSHLQTLTDAAINSSVTLVNQEIQNSVEKKLGSFKLTTEMLALKDPSKEALSDWYFNMVNLNKLAFHEIKSLGIIKEDSEIERLSLTLVNALVSGWITRAASITLHEKAHADAALEAGATSTWYALENNPDAHLTIGGLFQQLITGSGRGTTWYNFNSPTTPEQNAVISGAGINKQTELAEGLAKESVSSGQFHQAEFMHYMFNKLSVPIYYMNDRNSKISDIKQYANALVDQGKIKQAEVNATMSKMAAYSTLSALLSGRTWEGLTATMNYVKSGDSTADTLKIKTPIGDIAWPEVNTYLNSDNISLKTSTSLKTTGKINYDASLEKSILGSDVTEVSVSAHMKSGRAMASLTAIANDQQKYGAKIHVAYDIDGKGRWFVYGGGSYDTGTLDGRRLFYQTDNAPKGKIYSGLEYRFR